MFVFAISVGAAVSVGAAQAQPQTFTIPAQSVEDALRELGQQADIDVEFALEDVAGLTSPGVSGATTRREAAAGLLDGTGLTYTLEEGLLIVRLPAEGDGRINSITPNGVTKLAQADGARGRAAAEEDDDYEEESIEEVIVTGSHIRGVGVSVGSKVETISRLDIGRGGFGTVPEVLQSLTQNFKGGINEDAVTSENNTNRTGGTSINLRGLGAGATLTLLNGRRLPRGGALGGFTDISNIPASAIERVEVLADGASAIYGSDAIGGVVNIILRDDFDGAETGLRIGTVTEGGSQEYRASQTFGKSWNTGHVLVSYEYYNRGSLNRSAKPFAASSDLRPLGGDDFRSHFSVPGNILDPATRLPVFAIPDGQDGTSLTVGDLLPGQVNLFNDNVARDLLKDQERHSVFFTASQELTNEIELFAEGRFSRRNFVDVPTAGKFTLSVPSSNPWFVDPFGGSSSIRVSYNGLNDFSAVQEKFHGDVTVYDGALGATVDLGSDWQAEFYGSYASESSTRFASSIDTGALRTALADPDPTTAFNPFGDGSFQQNPATLNSISGVQEDQFFTEVWTGNLIVDGPLFQMPGGDVKVALGANYSKNSFDSFSFTPSSGILADSSHERESTALFGEILAPLIGENNRRAGLERLMLSASVRYEDYDDVGSTTDPKIGVLWSPVKGLDIRGAWGTSYKAPDLIELDVAGNLSLISILLDPMSMTGVSSVLILTGGNSSLKSETATTWNVGFDYAPPAVPGLTFDLTYYNIDFKDRISRATPLTQVFLNEKRFASAITRNPSQAEIDEACSIEGFLDFGGDCLTTPIGAIVDGRLINTAVTKTDGLDFNIRYGFETQGSGRFDFHVGGTYILSFDEAFGPTAPVVALVNTVFNPIGLRLRNSLTWGNQSGLSASAFLNYSDSYTDTISSPERKIESWTTLDLTVAYNTEDRLGSMGLNNTLLSLSVRNMFDTDPPFVNNASGIGYDPQNASPLGRFISFNVTKKW